MSVIIETARLRLEDWTDAAIDELVALHADPEVQRYLDPNGESWSRDMVEKRLAEWRAEQRDLGLGKHRLVRREDGVFVGRAGFSEFGEGREIGYSLVRAHWGKGYATEIGLALSDWFFANQPDDSFVGFTHRDNIASQAVLRRIGMEYTGPRELAGLPHEFFIKRRPA